VLGTVTVMVEVDPTRVEGHVAAQSFKSMAYISFINMCVKPEVLPDLIDWAAVWWLVALTRG